MSNDYSTEFFTTTYTDQTYRECYQLIAVVPRLKEIIYWLQWLTSPLKNLDGFDELSESELETLQDDVISGAWTALQTHCESYLTATQEDIETAIEQYLAGYYQLNVAFAETIALDIIASQWEFLKSGLEIPYKETIQSDMSELITIGADYKLTEWDHRLFKGLGELYYEDYANLTFKKVSTGAWTWQYARAICETDKMIEGGEFDVVWVDFDGSEHTRYTLKYTVNYWQTIGSRRYNYLPPETANYVHYVSPKLMHTTDPATRGGLYSNYTGSAWENPTEAPETMGSPWAGDEDEKPYAENLYDWTNVDVNPPGFSDESHAFKTLLEVTRVYFGTGRDPAGLKWPPAPPFLWGPRPGSLTGLNPLEQLTPWKKKHR